jgi:glycosyltransferase involved in cell wall biosynthesis
MLYIIRFLRQADSNSLTVLMDGRSTRSNRTSGWERYAREISRVSKSSVIPSFRFENIPLISDLILALLLSGHRGFVHFPTFPPLIAKRNYVFTLHDLTWWLHPETSSFLGKHLYKKLAEAAIRRCFLIVPSESVKKELLDQFAVERNRIFVVHNGLTTLVLDPSLKKLDLPIKFILVVGTLEPRKNLHSFVKAYLASNAKNYYKLVLVGRQGWGQEPPNVILLSKLKDSELAEVYNRASAFFLPSLYEGFGLPLLEALAHELPVFCSDISVFREVGGSSCNYFDPRSISEMVNALNAFVNGSYVQDKSGSQQVWKNYTWDSSGEKIQKVYKEIARTVESNSHEEK